MTTATGRPPRPPGPRLLAGAVGGFLAGVVFIALYSWFATTVGMPALSPFRVIASLAQGPDAVRAGTADVWVGMAIHAALSVLFGLVFAVFTARIRSNWLIAVFGLLYGGAIYAVDFQVLARFIDQFHALLARPNQPMVLTVHLLYGMLLTLFVMRPHT